MKKRIHLLAVLLGFGTWGASVRAQQHYKSCIVSMYVAQGTCWPSPAAARSIPSSSPGGYAQGEFYVLAIPNDPADLYALPSSVLSAIRAVLASAEPIRIESAPAEVALFRYDNGALMVQNHLPCDRGHSFCRGPRRADSRTACRQKRSHRHRQMDRVSVDSAAALADAARHLRRAPPSHSPYRQSTLLSSKCW